MDNAEPRGATPLVITPSLPPTTGQDLHGLNRRLSTFMDAISDGNRPIRLLRLVPEQILQEWLGQPKYLNRIESDFWGHQVEVTMVPRQGRTETLYRHYIQGAMDAAYQPEIFPFGGVASIGEITRQLNEATSLVLVHRLSAMCAMLRTTKRPAKMFFDLDDVEHRKRLRYITQSPIWPGKLAYVLHVPALLRAERRGAKLSKATFVCSDQDRDDLVRLGLPNVTVAPNAIKAPLSIPPLTIEPTILFLGLMTYLPNLEAAIRLTKKIMPLVWSKVPAARLLIAGNGSDALLTSQGSDWRIEYLGFVPDLDALYARSRIICCPIKNGGGTRIKLIEAAAYGKPIVATAVGAEGLAFADGVDLLIRNDDASSAEACVRLLGDDALCLRLGASANQKMYNLYERSSICRMLRGVIEQAVP